MKAIAILGIFVADAAFVAGRQPKMGETIKGSGFALGPGGKGSNQAVAAARLGSRVRFISRLGNDEFARMALSMWETEGIDAYARLDPESFTGAAYIFIEEATRNNAIIVVPGAAGIISPADIAENCAVIVDAGIFMTQLETSVGTSIAGLEIARSAGVTTVLNPAPAVELDDRVYGLCDYLTPNESEAALLTGRSVESPEDARLAASELRRKGAGTAIITLGDKGAWFDNGSESLHVPPFNAGPVVETTGAGDAFCGALVHALSNGNEPIAATSFACAAASISVTRAGTAPSMPTADEVAALLKNQ